MLHIVLGLAPIFLLIVLGYGMRRSRWIPDDFWPVAEKITYFVFFPSLLINNTAKAHLAGIDILPMAAALILPIFAVTGIALLVRPLLNADGPSFTSVIQGNIRPNTYVGIAAAVAMYDEPGLTLTAVALVCCVPTVNVISVTALVRYASPPGTAFQWRRAVWPVVTNPLILSPLAGAALNATGVGSPPVVGDLLEFLGRAALPLGLLAVGAGLDPKAIRPSGRLVAVSGVLKLAMMPLFTFLMCRLLGQEALTTAVCVIYAALPVSASSYVLSRQMGGNAGLMAGIITASTLAAMGVIPLAIALLG